MTEQSLFRPQAVEFHRQHRQWGEVALLQPAPTRVMVWFIATAVALLITLAFLAQYARKETVRGYLTPTAGTARIFAPKQGVVQAIHVEEGQSVRKGQPLLTVATAQITADDEDVDAAILDTLAAQHEALRQQIVAQGHRMTSERARLAALIKGLENEIEHLESQISTQDDRVRLSKEFVAAAAKLSKGGHMPEAEHRRRQEEHLEQRQALSSLNQQLAARHNQLVERRYALDQLPIAIAEQTQSLRNELSEVEQRIAEIRGRRAYIIRAPIAGRVSALQATIGRTAAPQHLQLELVPADSVLQAELFVPTRAIGFVRAGQEVRILYDAFPYQSFGAYVGRVVEVSQTILTSTDIAAPLALDEPAYRVTVRLGRPDVDAYGKRVPLQAGMLLRADIILERQSLMDWLLAPLRNARM